MISPRQQFQKTLAPDSKFRNIVASDEFQNACAFSLAQLAIEEPDSAKIAGAKRFMEIISTIANPEKEPTKFPDRRLQAPDAPTSDKKK